MEKADLIIVNGLVITMDYNRRIITNGAIAIRKSKILDIATSSTIKKKYKAKKTIDAKNKIVMPGLINAHTHAPMTLFRGYVDDIPLHLWLENYIWPAETQYINKNTVRKGAALAILEMIKTGTTTFCDMYFYEDEVAKVAKEMGMRAIIGEGLIATVNPGYKTIQDGLKRTKQLIKKWNGDDLIIPSVAVHSALTCPPPLLKAAKKIATTHGLLFKIIASETKTEIKEIKRTTKKTPIEYLDELDLLHANVAIAHGVHLTKNDIKLIKKNNVGIIHLPESNMKLSSGISPVFSMIIEGIKIGLGTDGPASNNNLNMLNEMDSAAKLHKLSMNDPTVLDALTCIEMATVGNAKVLGIADKTGSLDIGKRADIIILDMEKPNMLPVYNPYSSIVYSTNGDEVETVIIDGKIVMKNRKIKNEKQIISEFKRISNKIKKENNR